MDDEPIDLDSRREKADRKAANQRREQLDLIETVHAAQALRQEDIEQTLLETPARSWSELAPKVRFLLETFAQSPEASQAQRKRLISQVLRELKRLTS